jgi:hypothetical protein
MWPRCGPAAGLVFGSVRSRTPPTLRFSTTKTRVAAPAMADTGAQVARLVTIAVDGSHALVGSTYCERNFYTLIFFFAE